MSQKTSRKERIDGDEYEVYMLNPKLAMKLLVKLLKLVGPSFGALVDQSQSGGLQQMLKTDVSSPTFAAAVAGLVDRLDEREIESIMDQMSEQSLVNGAPLKQKFEVHFLGRNFTMLKWFGFALKTQYADFFQNWDAGSNPSAGVTTLPVSQSLNTSTG